MANPEWRTSHETPPLNYERKFLFNPDFELPLIVTESYYQDIIQGYIGDSEVCLRRADREDADSQYTVSFQPGQGMVARPLSGSDLSETAFAALWPTVDPDQIIYKRRYNVSQADRIVELDVFDGNLKGLIIAEVEFADEQEARAFQQPDWFDTSVREVTDDPLYFNRALARYPDFLAARAAQLLLSDRLES